ncbi:alpha/beta fold hydrolase [Nocardioides sambongensis]|uniref:alpha/beta fold hydrolase n=1 Tax=Nocardioides sambongensis TaxID=2589074 RepID=UPI0015E86BA1|nr:alpha/beta hydrolase [Nocardioides sambongensis]
MPRAFQDRLAHVLASAGLHVVVPDLLGHGRSDRPADPMAYSVTAFAEQVVGLLDHLGATQAVVGGTGIGANVALEVAVEAGARVRGLLLDGPVLEDALTTEVGTLTPLLYLARFAPLGVRAAGWAARPVPRRLLPGQARVGVDMLEQQPAPLAALVHGVLFGRLAPSLLERQAITTPALVIARPGDPFRRVSDAEALAEQLPTASLERVEVPWRRDRAPEQLDMAVSRFVLDAARPKGIRRSRRGGA